MRDGRQLKWQQVKVAEWLEQYWELTVEADKWHKEHWRTKKEHAKPKTHQTVKQCQNHKDPYSITMGYDWWQ